MIDDATEIVFLETYLDVSPSFASQEIFSQEPLCGVVSVETLHLLNKPCEAERHIYPIK